MAVVGRVVVVVVVLSLALLGDRVPVIVAIMSLFKLIRLVHEGELLRWCG